MYFATWRASSGRKAWCLWSQHVFKRPSSTTSSWSTNTNYFPSSFLRENLNSHKINASRCKIVKRSHAAHFIGCYSLKTLCHYVMGRFSCNFVVNSKSEPFQMKRNNFYCLVAAEIFMWHVSCQRTHATLMKQKQKRKKGWIWVDQP